MRHLAWMGLAVALRRGNGAKRREGAPLGTPRCGTRPARRWMPRSGSATSPASAVTWRGPRRPIAPRSRSTSARRSGWPTPRSRGRLTRARVGIGGAKGRAVRKKAATKQEGVFPAGRPAAFPPQQATPGSRWIGRDIRGTGVARSQSGRRRAVGRRQHGGGALFDPGVTGLAILAMLGSGIHGRGTDRVRRQRAEGAECPDEVAGQRRLHRYPRVAVVHLQPLPSRRPRFVRPMRLRATRATSRWRRRPPTTS